MMTVEFSLNQDSAAEEWKKERKANGVVCLCYGFMLVTQDENKGGITSVVVVIIIVVLVVVFI